MHERDRKNYRKVFVGHQNVLFYLKRVAMLPTLRTTGVEHSEKLSVALVHEIVKSSCIFHEALL